MFEITAFHRTYTMLNYQLTWEIKLLDGTPTMYVKLICVLSIQLHHVAAKSRRPFSKLNKDSWSYLQYGTYHTAPRWWRLENLLHWFPGLDIISLCLKSWIARISSFLQFFFYKIHPSLPKGFTLCMVAWLYYVIWLFYASWMMCMGVFTLKILK